MYTDTNGFPDHSPSQGKPVLQGAHPPENNSIWGDSLPRSTLSQWCLGQDLKSLQEDPSAGASGAQAKNNIRVCDADIWGPEGILFEDGTFKLIILSWPKSSFGFFSMMALVALSCLLLHSKQFY